VVHSALYNIGIVTFRHCDASECRYDLHCDASTSWDSALCRSAPLHSARWDSAPSRRAEILHTFLQSGDLRLFTSGTFLKITEETTFLG
jgi:hypothetical protein